MRKVLIKNIKYNNVEEEDTYLDVKWGTELIIFDLDLEIDFEIDHKDGSEDINITNYRATIENINEVFYKKGHAYFFQDALNFKKEILEDNLKNILESNLDLLEESINSGLGEDEEFEFEFSEELEVGFKY